MSSLSTLEGERLAVVLGAQSVGSVDSFQLMTKSLRYRCGHVAVGGVLRIESPVAVASLLEFLGDCEGTPATITTTNVTDLLLLCNEWNVPDLKSRVEEFLGSHEEEMVIQCIAACLKQGSNTRAFEEKLHQYFLTLCSKGLYKDLADLGMPVLHRVFQMDNRSLIREHLHDVFDFIMSCFDVFGSATSILLSGVRLEDLTSDERQRLLIEDRMDFSCLVAPSFKTCIEAESVASKYHILFEESEKARIEQSKEIEELKTQVSKLAALVEEANERYGERLEQEIMGLKRDVQQSILSCSHSHKAASATLYCEQCQKTLVFSPSSVWRPNEYGSVIDCSHQPGSYSGIFSRLANACDRNPHEAGLISVTVSSTDTNNCWHVIESGWNGIWSSKSENQPFIQFDFRSNRVLLSKYMLRMPPSKSFCLFSWVVEAKEYLEDEWVPIDERGPIHNDKSSTAFECKSNTFYQFVRIRQTVKSTGDGSMQLCWVELFGKLAVGYDLAVKDGEISKLTS